MILLLKKKFLVLLQEEFEDTKGAIMYLQKLFLVPLQVSFNMQLFHFLPQIKESTDLQCYFSHVPKKSFPSTVARRV
jgi:hypothetical protein